MRSRRRSRNVPQIRRAAISLSLSRKHRMNPTDRLNPRSSLIHNYNNHRLRLWHDSLWLYRARANCIDRNEAVRIRAAFSSQLAGKSWGDAATLVQVVGQGRRIIRCAAAGHDLDDDHTAAAAGTGTRQHVRHGGFGGLITVRFFLAWGPWQAIHEPWRSWL